MAKASKPHPTDADAAWWNSRPLPQFSKEEIEQAAVLWVGFLYELIARDEGKYPLGKRFDQLPRAALLTLVDMLSETLPKVARSSPLVSYHEVLALRRAAKNDWDGDTLEDWSEPFCFNLGRHPGEIRAAVGKKIAALQKDLSAKQRKLIRFTEPPWAEVEAYTVYLQPKPERPKVLDSQKTSKNEGKNRLDGWRAKHPGTWDAAIIAARRAGKL